MSVTEGISVIVVNYRTPRLLENFVDSYYAQSSKVPTELIIIDVDVTESSLEESKQILSKYRDQGHVFQYWPMFHNCGYSGACNYAATVSTKEVVAFFNADTSLFDDTLDICFNYLKHHPQVAICGPLQVNSQGRITHAGIVGTNKNPQHRGWQSSNPKNYRDNIEDVVSVSGSAYFIKRNIWDILTDKLKEYEPATEGAMLNTFLYYEETWVSYLARHLGYKVAYVGEAIMIHEWDASPKKFKDKLMKESRKQFRQACSHFGIECD